jgi:2-polyprenyl-6-methoxyphenol hydroxylase-like FAD-dependent oxidoreductase
MVDNGASAGQRSRRQTAIIIGGSMAGLFAGTMLYRQGWHVEIFEQAEGPLGVRGAGIAGHAELSDVLAACGIDEPRPPAVDVAGRHAYDRKGQLIQFYAHPQYMTYWRNMFRLLFNRFPATHYHGGVSLEALEIRGNRAEVRLSNGRVESPDLVIGADGLRSKVRSVLAPSARPRYAGYFAFRGLVPEASLSARFRRDVFDKYVFIFPQDGQFCGLPLCGPGNEMEAGLRLYTYLWYKRAVGAERADLLTDVHGTVHAESIPPPLIRPEHFGRLTALAAATLPAPFDETVLRASQHIFQPIFDMESEQIVFANVSLVGDAAFVARPHVGIGVLKAGQDALALCRALADNSDIAASLAAYEQARLPVGRNAVRLARYLGRFIELGHDGPAADPTLQLSPELIIAASGRPIEQAEPILGEARKAIIGWQ